MCYNYSIDLNINLIYENGNINMALENELKGLESWSSYNLSINKNGHAFLSGENSLYESYLDFVSKESLKVLPLRRFCTDIILLYALKHNVLLEKRRMTRGIKITGLELADKPIKKIENNSSVTYKFK